MYVVIDGFVLTIYFLCSAQLRYHILLCTIVSTYIYTECPVSTIYIQTTDQTTEQVVWFMQFLDLASQSTLSTSRGHVDCVHDAAHLCEIQLADQSEAPPTAQAYVPPQINEYPFIWSEMLQSPRKWKKKREKKKVKKSSWV